MAVRPALVQGILDLGTGADISDSHVSRLSMITSCVEAVDELTKLRNKMYLRRIWAGNVPSVAKALHSV